MGELGLPELSTDQIEELCSVAEQVACKYVLSKVSQKVLERLDVCAEVEGSKPVKLTVDVDIELAHSVENVDPEELVEDAVAAAFKAAEMYLKDLRCPPSK